MEIEYFGANCFRVKTKKTSVVFDDNLDSLGKKNITKNGEALFYTQEALKSEKASSSAKLVVDCPGEFEVGDLSVKAQSNRSHLDEEGKSSATVFQCTHSGVSVTVLGHVHGELSEEVLEMVSGTDVLIVPVGGNGFTLDAVGAVSVVKSTEPAVVIPSQYDAAGFKFEVPAAPLDDFIKTSALKVAEAQDCYKVDKPDVELSESTHIVKLNIKKA